MNTDIKNKLIYFISLSDMMTIVYNISTYHTLIIVAIPMIDSIISHMHFGTRKKKGQANNISTIFG